MSICDPTTQDFIVATNWYATVSSPDQSERIAGASDSSLILPGLGWHTQALRSWIRLHTPRGMASTEFVASGWPDRRKPAS